MKNNTYNYNGKVIPQTTFFVNPGRELSKVPLPRLLKLPTYQSLHSLRKQPQKLVVKINGEEARTFNINSKGEYKNGKESDIDFLLFVEKNRNAYADKNGKLKVEIVKP